MGRELKKKILIALGIIGFIAFQLWRVRHKQPLTAEQIKKKAALIKEFEDEENMFPGPQ